ncbi:hypothetical protein KBC70_00400 [Candidatus Woesebacteria bacterium]|nr:hypothetical protein [Candidatus Woesebacteria bacterium]
MIQIIIRERKILKDYYFSISWKLMGEMALLFIVTVSSSVAIRSLNPKIMDFSWLNIFNVQGANINLAGSDIPYFGKAIIILLLAVLPALAETEEKIFREGTNNWLDGTVRSICFGLVHCVVGVPIGIGLAITIPGMYFTFKYFKGGIRLSSQAHFQYNVIAVMTLLLIQINNTFGV